MLKDEIYYQNAYNEQNNNSYCYQKHDILNIGSAICSANNNVIFVSQNELDGLIIESKTYISQLSAALYNNKKVVGIYKTNEAYWIPYCLIVSSGKMICFYNHLCNFQSTDFLKAISSAFPNCLSQQLCQGSIETQHDSFSSGTFALYDLKIFAEDLNFSEDSFLKKFNPKPEDLNFYRSIFFPKKYIEGCLIKAIHKGNCGNAPLGEDKNSPQVDFNVSDDNTLLDSPNDVLDKNSTFETHDLERVLKEVTSTDILPYLDQKENFIDIIKTTEFKINIKKTHFSVNFNVLDYKQIERVFDISHPKQNKNDGYLATKSFNEEIKENILSQLAITNNATLSDLNCTSIQENFKIIVYPRDLCEDIKRLSENFSQSSLLEKNSYVKWDHCSLLSINNSNNEGLYYPTDLVHGLLAEHCTSCGTAADHSIIQPGSNVEISSKKTSYINKLGNINQYLKAWKVLGIIDGKQTRYLGVIYANDEARQIVLAHKSINFELSLMTENSYKKSGLKHNIASFFMGEILLYQVYGYVACDAVIELLKNCSKYAEYAFSITGHSLGAWLAELSAFYCCRYLNYPNVKTVSFDGPGARETIEKFTNNDKISFDFEKLNIVSYVSAPSLVNCLNKHFGTMFTSDSEITCESPKIPSNFSQTNKKIFPTKSKRKEFISLQNFGHDLISIVTHFDPKNEELHCSKPKLFSKVEIWPSISYKHIENTSYKQSFKYILEKFLKTIDDGGQIGKVAFELCDKLINNNEESTTLESIVQLALDIYNKKIDHGQFRISHEHMNKSGNYKQLVRQSLNQFQLYFDTEYQKTPVNKKVSKINDIEKNIGDCLICLKAEDKYVQSMPNDLAEKIINLTSKYDYVLNDKEIRVIDEHTSIDDLKNEIQTLIYRFKLEWYLQDGYKMERLYSINFNNPNIQKNSSLNEIKDDSSLNNIKKVLQEKSLVIIKGMPGAGKTNLAKQYAQLYQNNITLIHLDVSQDAIFEKLLNFQTVVWNIVEKNFETKNYSPKNQNEALDVFSRILEMNLQRVLFILDNARNWNNIMLIIKRFESLEKNGRIKYIITTRHHFLPGTDHLTYVHLLPNTISQNNLPEDKLLNLLIFLNSKLNVKDFKTLSAKLDTQLKTLCENSYGFINKNGDIQLETNVQKIARECKKRCSALEFLILASKYPPNIIDNDYICNHFETYKLDEFYTAITDNVKRKNDIKHPYHLKFLMTNVLSSKLDMSSNMDIKYFIDFLLEKQYELLGKKITKINYEYEASIIAENRNNFVSNISNEISDLVKYIPEFERDHSLFSSKISTDKNIIVFGPTGSGKSTIINALLGNSLICTDEGDDGQPAKIVVQDTNSCPIIGNISSRSQTFDVNGWTKENTTYIDCPGLVDSRGLFFEMNNARKLKSLSLITKKGIALMIVVSAALINGKGRMFADFLDQLDRTFIADSFKRNALLVITQTLKPNIETYVQTLRDHCEELKKQDKVSKFLNLFLNHDFISRIIFVRKINISGEKVMPSYFEDLQNALSKLEFCNCTLNTYSISPTYKDELSKLGNALNEYVVYKKKCLVLQINKSLLKEVETSDKNGKELKRFIMEKTSFIEADQLKQQTENFYRGYDEDIEQISKTLLFLNLYNPTVKAEILDCEAVLRPISKNYHTLSKNIITQHTDNQLIVTGLIVSVSEIDDVIIKMRNVPHYIWVEAKMFLVDKSVVWRWKSEYSVIKYVENGTNLYVKALKCKVVDVHQTIDISGKNGINPGDNGGNGGSFYGKFDFFFGGKLIVDIRGGDGVDGQFDITKRLDAVTFSIEELKKRNDYFKTIAKICRQKEHSEILNELTQFKSHLSNLHKKHEECILNIEKLQTEVQQSQRQDLPIKLLFYKYEHGLITRKKQEISDLNTEKRSFEQGILETKKKVEEFENAASFKVLNDLKNKRLEISSKIDSNKKSLHEVPKDIIDEEKNVKETQSITMIQKKVQEIKADLAETENVKNKSSFDHLKVILSTLEDISIRINNVNDTFSIEDIDKNKSKSNINIQTMPEYKELQEQTEKCQKEKMSFFIAGIEHKYSSDEIEIYMQSIKSELDKFKNEKKEIETHIELIKKPMQDFLEELNKYKILLTKKNCIEADYKKMFEKCEKSGINLEELKTYKRDIQKFYEVLQDKENELTLVLLKKDSAVIGSNEQFSEDEKKVIKDGNLLSSIKNYSNLVKNYLHEKEKLIDYEKKLNSNFDKNEDVKLEQELRFLIEENICLNIKKKLLEAEYALVKLEKKGREKLKEKKNTELLEVKRDTEDFKEKNDEKQFEEKKDAVHLEGKKKTEHLEVKKDTEYLEEKTEHLEEKKDTEYLEEKKDTENFEEKKGREDIKEKSKTEHLDEKEDIGHLNEKKDAEHLEEKKDTEQFEENFKMYQNKLKDNRNKCKIFLKNKNCKLSLNDNATEREFDNAISFFYGNLQSKVQIISELNINLVERVNYAEMYATWINEAYKSYEQAVIDLNKKKSEYKCWKKKQNNEQQPLINILDTLLKHQDMLYDQFYAISKTTEVLLLQEAALVSRVRRQWEDRSKSEKISYYIKEILCFNTQFVEKYKLDGQDGGNGGNSGSFFLNDDFKKSCPGAGGSSMTLLGVYINEYSYAKLREINEKEEFKNAGISVADFFSIVQGPVVTGAVQVTKKIAEKTSTTSLAQMFTFSAGKKVLALPGYALGTAFFISQLLASPFVAALSCQWVHGPFLYAKKNQDGTEKDCPLELNLFAKGHLKLTNEMELAANFIYSKNL